MSWATTPGNQAAEKLQEPAISNKGLFPSLEAGLNLCHRLGNKPLLLIAGSQIIMVDRNQKAFWIRSIARPSWGNCCMTFLYLHLAEGDHNHQTCSIHFARDRNSHAAHIQTDASSRTATYRDIERGYCREPYRMNVTFSRKASIAILDTSFDVHIFVAFQSHKKFG